MTVSFSHFAREHGPRSAVRVSDVSFNDNSFAFQQSGRCLLDQFAIKNLINAMVLAAHTFCGHGAVHIGFCEESVEIEALGFPMGNGFFGVKPFGGADQFIISFDAHMGHQSAQFFCNKEEEVDHMFWLAFEALAQLRVLRGNANGAGV